jgi:hypothetical protein
VSATWICDAYSTREKCAAEIADVPHPTMLQTFTNGCAVALVVAQLMGHSKVDTEFDVYTQS